MILRNSLRSMLINLRIIVRSSNFYLAILLLFVVLAAENIQDLIYPPNLEYIDQTIWADAYMFNVSLHFGYYIYAAPLACAFAAGWLFCADYETRFYQLRLMRSGKKAYPYGLFFGGTIGGGLTLAIAVGLYAVFCSILYYPTQFDPNFAAADAWYPILRSFLGNWKYMLVHAVLAFVFGLVWAGVSLLVSLLSPMRYVAYIVPFIICFCASFLLPDSMQPLEMLVQMGWYHFSFFQLMLYQFSLYFLIMIAFIVLFNRRYLRE